MTPTPNPTPARGTVEWACEVLNRHKHNGRASYFLSLPDSGFFEPLVMDMAGYKLTPFEAIAIAAAYEPEPDANAEALVEAACRALEIADYVQNINIIMQYVIQSRIMLKEILAVYRAAHPLKEPTDANQ